MEPRLALSLKSSEDANESAYMNRAIGKLFTNYLNNDYKKVVKETEERETKKKPPSKKVR